MLTWYTHEYSQRICNLSQQTTVQVWGITISIHSSVFWTSACPQLTQLFNTEFLSCGAAETDYQQGADSLSPPTPTPHPPRIFHCRIYTSSEPSLNYRDKCSSTMCKSACYSMVITCLIDVGYNYEHHSGTIHGSFKILTCSGMEIRSPLIRVSTLLSSMTEFMDSIHRVSTGASNSNHFWSGFSSAQVCLMTEERTPSVHSLVLRSNSPYSSPRESAFGFIGKS